MSTQGELFGFNKKAAIADKQQGMGQVDRGASADWKAAMASAVTDTARRLPRFTTDDVFKTFYQRAALPPVTRDKRALGPVMLRAAQNGVCKKSNGPWVPTSRRSRHAAPLQVWESLIYGLSA